MDTRPPERQRRRRLRILFGVLLVMAFVGSLGWILLKRPPLTVLVILIVVAAVTAAAFSAYFVPNKLSERFKRAFTVGAAAVGLITTLVAVPAIQNDSGAQPATKDPLSATLSFGFCENFTVPTELLPSLPPGADLNAQWVYDHSGATSNNVLSLTVHGTTQDVVTLQRLHVLDLKTQATPSNTAYLYPCGRIRRQVVPVRYFEMNLDDPAQVIARPAPGPNPQTGEIEQATTFPYQVSNTEAESFLIIVRGLACFCAWRLGLDWTSGERSGTTIVDHGFGEVRTDTSGYDRAEYLRKRDGTWEPPLPK
jgi:hypothetical protein